MKQSANEELQKLKPKLVSVNDLINGLIALRERAFADGINSDDIYIVIKSPNGEWTTNFQILGTACHEERLNLDSEDSYISTYIG